MNSSSISRRHFGKGLVAAGTLSFVRPIELFAVNSGTAATATPASVSKEAAELYRRAFVLDCNTLAGLNYEDFKKSPEDQGKFRSSGVNVVKVTLGGAAGNFEEAVKAIAAANELMEKAPDFFLKV